MPTTKIELIHAHETNNTNKNIFISTEKSRVEKIKSLGMGNWASKSDDANVFFFFFDIFLTITARLDYIEFG